VVYRELVPNWEIPGREEEVEQWIEKDEERRNWPDEEKANLLFGSTLVERVMSGDEIINHAIERIKIKDYKVISHERMRKRFIGKIIEDQEYDDLMQKEFDEGILDIDECLTRIERNMSLIAIMQKNARSSSPDAHELINENIKLLSLARELRNIELSKTEEGA